MQNSWGSVEEQFIRVSTNSEVKRQIRGVLSIPLAPVTHFTNLTDNLSHADLKQILQGKKKFWTSPLGAKTPLHFYLTKEQAQILRVLTGLTPKNVISVTRAEWSQKITRDKGFFSIIPWNEVSQKAKVLSVDNVYFFGAERKNYQLKFQRDSLFLYKLGGKLKIRSDRILKFSEIVQTAFFLAPYFFEPSLVKTLIHTGTTAVARSLLRGIELTGDPLCKIKDIWPVVAAADLAHMSNEVSVVPDCRYERGTMKFCTNNANYQLMEKLGIDVVELSGNHNNDYGVEYNQSTIREYRKRGLVLFGGGENIEEAKRIGQAHLGQAKVAFVSFNEYGPPKQWATKNQAGALPLTAKDWQEQIKKGRENSDLLSVHCQWGNESHPKALGKQLTWSRKAIDWGADFVIGSSAHGVQGLEFYRGKLILWGLGNFLFDQVYNEHVKLGMLSRHIVYGKKVLQTQLIPYRSTDDGFGLKFLKGVGKENFFRFLFRYLYYRPD